MGYLYFDMVIGRVIREKGDAIEFLSTFLLDVSTSMLVHGFIVNHTKKVGFLST